MLMEKDSTPHFYQITIKSLANTKEASTLENLQMIIFNILGHLICKVGTHFYLKCRPFVIVCCENFI